MDANNSPFFPELSIIIPAFNKESCISETVYAVVEVIKGTDYSFEIIIIDDFSTDNTFEILESLSIPQLRTFRNEKNLGKGYSIRRGIGSCLATKYIGYVDADLDIKPHAILTAIECLDQEKGIGICIGSKFHRASIVQTTRLRKIQSYCFAYLFRSLFRINISDSQSGLKLGRADHFRRLASQTRINGFAFDVEFLFLAHCDKVRILEIPIMLSGNHLTTIGFMSSLQSVYDLFAIYRRLSRAKSRK